MAIVIKILFMHTLLIGHWFGIGRTLLQSSNEKRLESILEQFWAFSCAYQFFEPRANPIKPTDADFFSLYP